ncbi:MAG: hypothetical protein IKG87_13475 [Clostridia bacterium]|nr:hypothetical protein [Clostridia bacterium]
MAYALHNFQDGQVLTGQAMDDIDQALLEHDEALTLLNQQMQKLRVVETGTVTLTNSQEFPFNNSRKTVALVTAQANSDYLVDVEVDEANGNVGEVIVSSRMTNGFAIEFTGSATSVTVNYFVIGGFTE